MKKHNTIKVVLITMLVFLLLTWILPAAYYSGQYVDQGRVQMGLFDLFNYPVTSLGYFGYIGLFFILVGGFYGILYKIPAYRSFLDKIVKAFEGKENLLLSIMIILISVLVSVCGMQFGIALFIPFVIALILLMGYDKIVAALVTAGSIAVGLIGTTYATNNTSVLISAFGLNYDFNIGIRFIILAAGIVLVILNTIMYAKANKKVKITKKVEEKIEKVEKEVVKKVATKKKEVKKAAAKKTTKSSKKGKSSNKAALFDEDVIVVPASVSGSHKIWPLVLTFSLLFILFVLAFISWSTFKVDMFDKATTAVQEFTLFKFPIFGKILGNVNAFGTWTITDLFLPMGLTILILALIYKVKLDDVIDGFIEGAKKALAPAVIVILLYTILVLVTYHPFQLVIYKAILGLSKGFNVATTTIVAFLTGIFNSDISYSYQAVAPYYASIITKTTNYPVVAVIFQAMYGLAMLVAPTSLVLMGILSYLKISYKEWLKNVWKLLLELFIILLIVFIIITLI